MSPVEKRICAWGWMEKRFAKSGKLHPNMSFTSKAYQTACLTKKVYLSSCKKEVVGNTPLLACWHWPTIGPTLTVEVLLLAQVGTTTTPQQWFLSNGQMIAQHMHTDYYRVIFLNIVRYYIPNPYIPKFRRWKLFLGKWNA